MSQYPGFVFFGSSHVITLIIIFCLCIAFWPLTRQALRKGWQSHIAWVFVVLICVELVVKVVLYRYYGMPWESVLPLQICDINAMLCALMLILRSYRIYEVSYFWAMGGSTMAMLTPDMLYGFPHPAYFIFYTGHLLTVLSVIFAILAFGFQPKLRSVGIAMLATVMYALVILVINFLLNTNYLYLLAKPTAPSLLDYMGPWPWYLLGLTGLCVVVYFLCYTPFLIKKGTSNIRVKQK